MAHNRVLIPQYAQCPLWVKSGHVHCNRQCPLYPQKRTLTDTHDIERRPRRASSAAGERERGDRKRVGGTSPTERPTGHKRNGGHDGDRRE